MLETFVMVLFVLYCILVIKAKDLTEQDGKEVGGEGKVQKDETTSSPYTWTLGFQSLDVVPSTRCIAVL